MKVQLIFASAYLFILNSRSSPVVLRRQTSLPKPECDPTLFKPIPSNPAPSNDTGTLTAHWHFLAEASPLLDTSLCAKAGPTPYNCMQFRWLYSLDIKYNAGDGGYQGKTSDYFLIFPLGCDTMGRKSHLVIARTFRVLRCRLPQFLRHNRRCIQPIPFGEAIFLRGRCGGSHRRERARDRTRR